MNKLNMGISIDVKTEGGDQFMDAAINYYGLDKAQLVEIEAALVNGLTLLLDTTREQSTEVKPEPQGIMR